MESKSRVTKWKYTVSMTYLDNKSKKTTDFTIDMIDYLIIDHDYDNNCMPIIYAQLEIDKMMLDDMILNVNHNLIMLAINKYDELSIEKQEVEVFRKKFVYFLPDDVNKTDDLDYNESNAETNIGMISRVVYVGLICVDHINNNKRTYKMAHKNIKIGDAANEVMAHFNNLIMEPIGDPTVIEQLVVPAQDSVSRMLMALNNIRVFYETPYRYYQDFTCTYLISSSGVGIRKSNEVYSSVIFDIKNMLSNRANELGVIINRSSKTYQIPVNYANVTVFDNSLTNKSRTSVTGMTATDGETKMNLSSKADFLSEKTATMRMENDNEGMLKNIKYDSDNNIFSIYIQKADLDSNVVTPNKRITVHNIDKYRDHDGCYIMYRKRECYFREDDSFIMNSMINLREIQK